MAAAAVAITAAVALAPGSRAAAQTQSTPSPVPSGAARPTTSGPIVLPANSTLTFVLDETIDSNGSRAGSVVRAHLRSALVLGGDTVAPAGTPVGIRVVAVTPAHHLRHGSVTISFEAMNLPGGKSLPLNTPTPSIGSHLPGRKLVLQPGAVLQARTASAIENLGGIITVSAPAPFSYTIERPYADFSPTPFATPQEFSVPTPKRSPAPKPSPSPTASP